MKSLERQLKCQLKCQLNSLVVAGLMMAWNVVRPQLAVAAGFDGPDPDQLNIDDVDDGSSPQKHSSGPSPSPSQNPLMVPDDIEFDQHELRSRKSWGAGLGFGEVEPYTTLTARVLKLWSPQRASTVGLGYGIHQSTGDSDGQQWSSLKAVVTMVDAKYLFWPSYNFPFSVQAGFSLEQMHGYVVSPNNSSGSGSLTTQIDFTQWMLYASAGLNLDYIFDNNIWLHWSLLNFNFGRSLANTDSGLSSDQRSAVTKRLSGLKIIGITNLSLGYVW